MTATSESASPAGAPAAALDAILDQLLRLGVLMLNAGDTAYRVRHHLGEAARRMGADSIAIQLGIGGIAASLRRDGELATALRELGSGGVNTWRIRALEELVRDLPPDTSPQELAARMAAIEATPPRYSVLQVLLVVGAACGAFAFLNGGGRTEILAAAIGGGLGQGARALLLRRHFNHYAVFALCALLAAATYAVLAALAFRAGVGATPRHAAGLVSSVLFLVPGFPLVAALLDLFRHEFGIGLARLVHATMLLLMAALGLAIVTVLGGFSLGDPAPVVVGQPLLALLRALASFVAAFGFAVLFSSSRRNAIYIGLVAIVGNELRLELRDLGVALPLATFAGAFAIGLMASLARRWLNGPRIALTVAGIVMMVPGVYAFETLVLFNQGEVLPALRAAMIFGFTAGAMAIGLVLAAFVSDSERSP